MNAGEFAIVRHEAAERVRLVGDKLKMQAAFLVAARDLGAQRVGSRCINGSIAVSAHAVARKERFEHGHGSYPPVPFFLPCIIAYSTWKSIPFRVRNGKFSGAAGTALCFFSFVLQ